MRCARDVQSVRCGEQRRREIHLRLQRRGLQIANPLVMLIGIVKKNAIMQIDFALEAERRHDKTPTEAIYEGCLIRFRPIMMTTMAALLGAVPMALGFGAGGEARRPLGLAVVGGLLVSQFITLYLTPVVYTYIAGKAGRAGSAGEVVPILPVPPSSRSASTPPR